MKTILISLFTAGLVLAWGTDAALAQSRNTSFEKKANAINEAAKKSGMMEVALRDISTQTGVPQDQLQAMHTKYPKAGPAGILLASVMAEQTKKPAETFLQSRINGKSWESIAAENKVSIRTLDQRLDQLQQGLNNPQPTSTATPVNRPT